MTGDSQFLVIRLRCEKTLQFNRETNFLKLYRAGRCSSQYFDQLKLFAT